MKKLDLPTLKWIKTNLEVYSDMTTKTLGYQFLCNQIAKIEENEKLRNK